MTGVGVGVNHTGDYQMSGAIYDLFRCEAIGFIGRAYNANASLIDTDRGVSKHAPPLIHGDDGGVVDKDVKFHIISLSFYAKGVIALWGGINPKCCPIYPFSP
jgi:hypothetical protein